MNYNKNIYLVLSKTGTWLSKSIGFVTQGDYTHASLSLDDSFTHMYSFGRINPNNPFYGGFTIENLYEGVYQRFTKCEVLIYKIPVSHEQYTLLMEQISKYAYSSERYKYNFLGLFTVLMDKPWKREYHYFCSQFISEILSKSNIWYSPKLPELTQPTDLINIENKEIFFKGPVKEFTSNLYKVSNY
ncbi:hypothetical protein [uncultured Clostridium sp.]|uniref:hypothetical protein n=1 Tax=uncultured Clostridium sp. TaxID=59620 RepID=UPI0025E0695B|nr:hypothetical protein [uncultured Clostridium sp.]